MSTVEFLEALTKAKQGFSEVDLRLLRKLEREHEEKELKEEQWSRQRGLRSERTKG